MPRSTFETLPDEILMTIFHYSGDIYTIFQTFSGLNQRLDNILVDRRLHLLTDFLCIDENDAITNYYYNFEEFLDISDQLSSISIAKNDQQFRQCLQSLVSFHIEYKHQQSACQLQSNIKQFRSIREQLTDDEALCVDMELEEVFRDLQNCPKPMKNIRQIEHLVLNKGASLQCSDSEHEEFNFAQALNRLFLTQNAMNQPASPRLINSFLQMFKNLVISNPKLLYNRAENGNDGGVIYFFLFQFIYRCQIWNTNTLPSDVNLSYYQAAVDLFLFALQGLYYEHAREYWGVNSFVDVLKMISPVTLPPAREIFVYTSQTEILKIIMEENLFNESMFWDEESDHVFREVLQLLIHSNRVDFLVFLFRHDEFIRELLFKFWDNSVIVDQLTDHAKGKAIFHELVNDPFLGTWLATNTDLLFVLLRKKQSQFIKRLLSISPALVNRLDEDGNDPLLYICLNVRGCRHRLVESLIRAGCDFQRKNSKNESFIDVLQLKRNEGLLAKLLDHEIIRIDEKSNVHFICE